MAAMGIVPTDDAGRAMEALKPEHADKTTPVAGTEFSVRRILVGYSYPNNGNLHNPTPNYRWLLILDDKIVDQDAQRGILIAAAREPDAAARYRER